MARANSSLLFYQSGKLVTVKEGDHNRAIFRTADVPLAEQQSGNSSGSGLLAIDEKESVLHVQVEDKKENHNYSVYGHAPTLPSRQTLLSFTGQYLQPSLFTYLLGNGYRAYSPILSRFYSPDSLSPFDAGGINSYGYCLGDPVNRTDGSGHAPTLPNSKAKFNAINTAWGTARKRGWESLFTEKKILTKIQPNLPSDDVLSLALVSKKIHSSVNMQSNKIANSKISLENLLEIDNWKFNGTLASSVSTRRRDIVLHQISHLVSLEEDFLSLNGLSMDTNSGRRHALVLRPDQQQATLSRHSSTDSLLDENRDIRERRRN